MKLKTPNMTLEEQIQTVRRQLLQQSECQTMQHQVDLLIELSKQRGSEMERGGFVEELIDNARA